MGVVGGYEWMVHQTYVTGSIYHMSSPLCLAVRYKPDCTFSISYVGFDIWHVSIRSKSKKNEVVDDDLEL